jgi:hypothetical protein
VSATAVDLVQADDGAARELMTMLQTTHRVFQRIASAATQLLEPTLLA